MTKDDKEALKEILTGFLTICGVIAVFLGLAYFLSNGTKVPPNERFQVVDTYKGCDLLRWNDGKVSTYKYVLYCPK